MVYERSVPKSDRGDAQEDSKTSMAPSIEKERQFLKDMARNRESAERLLRNVDTLVQAEAEQVFKVILEKGGDRDANEKLWQEKVAPVECELVNERLEVFERAGDQMKASIEKRVKTWPSNWTKLRIEAHAAIETHFRRLRDVKTFILEGKRKRSERFETLLGNKSPPPSEHSPSKSSPNSPSSKSNTNTSDAKPKEKPLPPPPTDSELLQSLDATVDDPSRVLSPEELEMLLREKVLLKKMKAEKDSIQLEITEVEKELDEILKEFQENGSNDGSSSTTDDNTSPDFTRVENVDGKGTEVGYNAEGTPLFAVTPYKCDGSAERALDEALATGQTKDGNSTTVKQNENSTTGTKTPTTTSNLSAAKPTTTNPTTEPTTVYDHIDLSKWSLPHLKDLQHKYRKRPWELLLDVKKEVKKVEKSLPASIKHDYFTRERLLKSVTRELGGEAIGMSKSIYRLAKLREVRLKEGMERIARYVWRMVERRDRELEEEEENGDNDYYLDSQDGEYYGDGFDDGLSSCSSGCESGSPLSSLDFGSGFGSAFGSPLQEGKSCPYKEIAELSLEPVEGSDSKEVPESAISSKSGGESAAIVTASGSCAADANGDGESPKNVNPLSFAQQSPTHKSGTVSRHQPKETTTSDFLQGVASSALGFFGLGTTGDQSSPLKQRALKDKTSSSGSSDKKSSRTVTRTPSRGGLLGHHRKISVAKNQSLQYEGSALGDSVSSLSSTAQSLTAGAASPASLEKNGSSQKDSETAKNDTAGRRSSASKLRKSKKSKKFKKFKEPKLTPPVQYKPLQELVDCKFGTLLEEVSKDDALLMEPEFLSVDEIDGILAGRSGLAGAAKDAPEKDVAKEAEEVTQGNTDVGGGKEDGEKEAKKDDTINTSSKGPVTISVTDNMGASTVSRSVDLEEEVVMIKKSGKCAPTYSG